MELRENSPINEETAWPSPASGREALAPTFILQAAWAGPCSSWLPTPEILISQRGQGTAGGITQPCSHASSPFLHGP